MWGAFNFFTSKCASRIFAPQWRAIVHLSSGQMAPHHRSREPTFRPSRATNQWKNTVSRNFPTFSRTCIFFLLSLSLLWSSHFFSSPPWLFPPAFPSVHIVGSLTSKLPSMIVSRSQVAIQRLPSSDWYRNQILCNSSLGTLAFAFALSCKLLLTAAGRTWTLVASLSEVFLAAIPSKEHIKYIPNKILMQYWIYQFWGPILGESSDMFICLHMFTIMQMRLVQSKKSYSYSTGQ